MTARSPWQRAMGARAADLTPALQTYFGAVPAGSEGRGSGVFTTVGTPRRWLWPVLALLAWDNVIFPVWERDVPFTIVNRPTAHGTIRASRTFHFPSGDRTMVDEVGITNSGLIDRLGRSGTVETALIATVTDGALTLRSTSTTLRFGPLRVPLGALSPRVILREESRGGAQSVALRLEAPVIGRIYEYAGTFTYTVASVA